MIKRVMEQPKTADTCTLTVAGNDFTIEVNGQRDNYDRLSSNDKAQQAFQKECTGRVKKGWVETPISLSRRSFKKLNEHGKATSFWVIELDKDQVLLQYGRLGDYYYDNWEHTGTRKVNAFDTDEEARYEYVKQILKKQKEGYADADPRDNEYSALIDNPPPKPKSARQTKKEVSKAKAASPAAGGAQRYEYDDGKSQKFWTIELQGVSHTVVFGKIGTSGQSRTKEHPSEEAARNSYEKLIAEKTGKGYELVASDAPTASEASVTANAAPSTPEVVTEVTNEIDLDPRDLARATFLQRQPLPTPAPAEFDLNDCVKRLSKIKAEQYGWVFQWQELNLSMGMSREEAHFWLEAMTFDRDRITPQQLARKIEGQKFDGKITVDGARKLIQRNLRGIPDEVAIAVGSLLSPEEFVELAQAKFNPKQPKNHYRDDWLPNEYRRALSSGLSAYVAPHLSEAEIEPVRAALRKDWDPTKSPDDSYSALPVEYYLAATCGMHDEVLAVVSSWTDDRYHKGDDWSDHYQRPQDVVIGLGSAKLVESQWRRLKLRMREPEHVRAFLACTRLAALDCIVDSILEKSNKDKCRVLLDELTRVRAPEAAAPMLQCKQSAKTPQVAREWLDRYVGNAVAGLIPTACGRGSLADAAIQYLRDAKRKGYAELIETAVAKLDGDAQRVRRDVIDYEEKVYQPLDDKSTPDWLREALDSARAIKAKKLPSWANVDALPPLVIGNHQLNDQQFAAMLTTLKASDFPDGHPLLAGLREHGQRESLEALAWRLFELWQEDGSPSKEKWAMHAVGFFGGDNAAFKLTPFIRAWPGESQHQRAVLGLLCLRCIGSDTALMQLNGIAQKVKFQGIKKQARECMELIAAEKGMTREELEDRVVPDLDLDERGRREFDFGPRKFMFALTPDMKPAVRDEAGKIRKDLPKPAAADDAQKAETAIADWKLLKKQLREAIKIQVPRMEQAMVTGRRWSPQQFESLLVRHPLMTHLTRTVLWGGYDAKGNLQTTFRVTEEQDFADVKDEALTLEEIDEVGIVHPLHLSEAESSGWGELFGDYEIASPFPQIGRAIHKLEKDETQAKSIDRFGNVKIPAVSLVGTLDRMGWIRGTPLDGGVFHEHSKPFYGANVTAVVEYEDGVPIGYMEGWDDQKVTGCFFLPGLAGSGWQYPDHKKGLALERVDSVVISEVLGDLYTLASKGS